MESLLSNLLTNWLSFLIVFFLLFTVIAYLLDRDKVGDMYLGILRVIYSLFYSPIIFLKKSILNLANFGRKGEKEYIPSKQFLLQKIVLFLETILVIISISFLVSGIIIGWNSFLPPLELRTARNNTEASLEDTKDKMGKISLTYQNLNKYWDSKKDSLISSRIGVNKDKLKKLEAKNKNLSQKFNNDTEINETYNIIKDYLDRNDYSSSLGGYENIKDQVISHVDGLSIGQNKINELKNYAENWYKIKAINYELGSFSEEDLRNEIQPNYREIEINYDRFSEHIANLESDLIYYNENIKYDILSLIKSIIISTLTAFLYIWIIGLMIEAINLSIDIANNVRIIREKKDPNTEK